MPKRTLASVIVLVIASVFAPGAIGQQAPAWGIGPFTRPGSGNPVIAPRPQSTFMDPMSKSLNHWEALHTFNPAAIVRNGKIVVLYRAEDNTGKMEIGMHTSRLGMAESSDGIHFSRRPAPVFYPADDNQKAREWTGGTEDPRLVESEDGLYVLTYTQWNRKIAQAGVATSRDLIHWTKYGPAFQDAAGGKYNSIWYKSAGILTRLDPAKGRLIAAKINGKYWMYWGEGDIHLATSTDLIHWAPLEYAPGDPVVLLGPRPGRFDSSFPECGPPPVLTDHGIVLIYNGKNGRIHNDPTIGPAAYAAGEALFDAHDPARLIEQTDHPVLKPSEPYEKSGQYVDGTTFSEGLVYFHHKWFLYYGCADSLVSVAIAPGTSGTTASAAPVEAGRPLTFEDMMAMKRLGETAVSPDGKWLAYGETDVNLGQNTKTPHLWVQPVAGGEPQKLAVALPGDSGAEFAPDGRHILFLSSREGGQQVWLADFDPATGAASHAKKLTSISTEADNAVWSPDGKSIVFTSFVYPDCPAITDADAAAGNKCNADRDAARAASKVKARIFTHLLYRHWDHFTGDKRSHLFYVSVQGGGIRDLTPGETHDVPPFSLEGGGCGCAFSPDSKELAYTVKEVPVPAISTNADIFTLDLTNPEAKPEKVSTSPGGDFTPAYSPDGKWLAWRSQERASYESDQFRLVLYDRAAKTIRNLMPDFPNWVDEFAWTPDSRSIVFVAGTTGAEPLYEVDVADGRYAPWATIGLDAAGRPQTHGDYGDLHILPDGRTVVATRVAIDDPGEAVRVSPVQAILDLGSMGPQYEAMLKARGEPLMKQFAPITHLNDALLAQLDMRGMESFWFTAKDGTRLQGFVIRPPAFDAARKYPVKFLIHGGPQGAWDDSWSYRWNAELFAANGYAVVMINPRGSTGYGQTIVDGVNGDWGGKPFTDLMTGLDYAEQHYPFIDKSRECALGASYGGYMANWVLGHTDRFKCIVSHDGMFNAESAFGSTEEDWFNIWEFRGHPWDYYGKPDDENPFRKWSPSLAAKNFRTPTLVVHGQLDYRLDVSEGFQLFDTLQMLGVPSKMLYFPDEGHWVLKPQNSQLWWKTVNDWVDEWTGKAGNKG